MAGKIFGQARVPLQEAVVERVEELIRALNVGPKSLDPTTATPNEMRAAMLRDCAALMIVRYSIIGELEQLGVPRNKSVDYSGELAMHTLSKAKNPEKKII